MWRFFMYGKLLKKTLSLLMPFFLHAKIIRINKTFQEDNIDSFFS